MKSGEDEPDDNSTHRKAYDDTAKYRKGTTELVLPGDYQVPNPRY
jgi:hypothetical protein